MTIAVVDPGGGSGVRTLPPPPPPSEPDTCLRLKLLHRQHRISLFNWRALHFATKLNSRDIQKCNSFEFIFTFLITKNSLGTLKPIAAKLQ